MSTPNISYNNFGCTVEKLVSMFPNQDIRGQRNEKEGIIRDFGGENNIKEFLGRAARNVMSMLKPSIFEQMCFPQWNLIVAPGTAVDGQTVFNTSLFPIVSGTLHVWRRAIPAYSGNPHPLYYGRYNSDFWDLGPPQIGYAEVPAANMTVDLTTGSITLDGSSAAPALTICEQVIASYSVDVNNSAYYSKSLADVTYVFAAAALGAIFIPQGSPAYSLVQSYIDQAKDYSERMLKGMFAVDDVNYARFVFPEKRNHRGIFTMDTHRTG